MHAQCRCRQIQEIPPERQYQERDRARDPDERVLLGQLGAAYQFDDRDQKRRALACHVSQFTVSAQDGVATRLTTPLFQQLVESRDAQFGALAGIPFAEGFVVREPLVRDSVFKTAISSQLSAFSSNREP